MAKIRKVDKPIVTDGDFSQSSNGINGNRVFFSMAKTINMGNYESIKVEYGEGRVVECNQSFDDVREEVKNNVMKCLFAMIKIVEDKVK